MTDVDHLWSRQEVADRLGISLRGLWNVRDQDPTFPAPVTLGRRKMWRPERIEAWLRQREKREASIGRSS